jgi:hypothetical protein
MLPKNCGQLLFNAVRETLETMAFAEVVPCSIKVGGEEFSQDDDDFSIGSSSVSTGNDSWGVGGNNSNFTDNEITNNSQQSDAWGMSASAANSNSANNSVSENSNVGNVGNVGDAGDSVKQGEKSVESRNSSDSWGSPDNGSVMSTSSSRTLPNDSFSSVSNSGDWNPNNNPDDNPNVNSNEPATGWEDIDSNRSQTSKSEWAPINTVAPSRDPWGDSEAVAAAPAATMALKEADFDEMVKQFAPDEWSWACMKVNSPDIHSVWFIVTKGLANVLARNMYAGEEFNLDNQLIKDLIAELTNVLGGKLMLLLEEMGGKFTLTVPEIGFGLPELPSEGYENAVCKVVVDGEHPVIVALCFNPGGINATGNVDVNANVRQ